MITPHSAADEYWAAVQAQADRMTDMHILDLFALDPRRAQRMQLRGAHGLILDYSRNCIDDNALRALEVLFNRCDAHGQLIAQLSGAEVNHTEQRPALHTAIRAALNGEKAPFDQQILAQYSSAVEFARSLYLGERRGGSGSPITDVVNLGIGGSDLGPRMACAALSHFTDGKVRVHFVSSLDNTELHSTLRDLSPETTLFLVSSKSFSTEETLFNARQAMAWFDQSCPPEQRQAHFAALTGKAEGAMALGIARELVFDVPDWIGGRYSLWSCSGLALMIAIGPERFAEFLRGGWLMDQHARDSDFASNMPAILAALEVWHCNMRHYGSLAVVPYSYQLRLVPAYLQQLVMESNGKSVTRSATPSTRATSPVLWGTAGTEGQHSYHQLLHQGTGIVPTDFILCLDIPGASAESQTRLASHCLAQSKALMEGKPIAQALRELLAQGVDENTAKMLAAHKSMPGNRPSNTIVLEQLNPQNLGALIALYEHKTFFASALWDINPFDQWGVELGKQLSQEIYPALQGSAAADFDASTNALIQLFQNHQQ